MVEYIQWKEGMHLKVAQVYIEYANMALDKTFSYSCAHFLVCPGVRVEVEFARRRISGFVWDVVEMSELEVAQIGYVLKPIIRVIDDAPLLNEELFALAQYMSRRCIAPLISCLDAMLPSKLKPRSSAQAKKMETWVIFSKNKLLSGSKQTKAMTYMETYKEVPRVRFNSLFVGILSKLEREGLVYLEKRECVGNVVYDYEDSVFTLRQEQEDAIDKMKLSTGFNTYLLHGVTGSGKSEVFLRMAQEVIEQGKQVLLLVPEIGLTPQMVRRVNARFKDQVAIYHSSLNNQEKYEQYTLVNTKKVSVVVGTRSAVFMPFDNLGLIIMDEEHDQSYKQDSQPKYHTKDIAAHRAKFHACPLVLASATPSLESYARAIKGVYTLVEMPTRINGCMPTTRLVDMKDAMRAGESYILSDDLKNAIQTRLARGEQSIILLNRRGYAPILRCMNCGEVPMCPHCDMALNYHKQSHAMKCHICGYSEPKESRCKACGSTTLRYVGMGTQKLEEYMRELFPSANITRMDVDTTGRKGAHEKLLSSFEKNGDILLGTQMIAKGLDFDNVTLVGILNGDALLQRSDYRSVELTFDLLVQASGRSGRKDKEGDVYIQVYDTSHYAITCAQMHDYKQFFMHEMQYRHRAGYPPYTYLGSITISYKDAAQLQAYATTIVEGLRIQEGKVLGPISLLKIMDQYRERIVIKGKDEGCISELMYNVLTKHIESKQKIKMDIDMNPLMLD